MGCPNVKFQGQVLPLASAPRVSRENSTNAHSIFAPLGKFETLAKPNYSTPCNCIVGPLEKKVLLSPVEFPAQSMTVSHPIRVDEYLKDHVCQASTCVQHTSTHDTAITSHDEPLNWPRLVLMAKGQPRKMILANQSQLVHSIRIMRNQLGCPSLGTHSIPKVIPSKGEEEIQMELGKAPKLKCSNSK